MTKVHMRVCLCVFTCTCSIICRSFLCWLLSMSSKWWIFSFKIAFSFSSSSNLLHDKATVYSNTQSMFKVKKGNITWQSVRYVMPPTSPSLHGPPPSVRAAAGVRLLWSWAGLWGWSSPAPCRPWDAGGLRSAYLAALCFAEPSSDTHSAQITSAYTDAPPPARRNKEELAQRAHLCFTIIQLSGILKPDLSIIGLKNCFVQWAVNCTFNCRPWQYFLLEILNSLKTICLLILHLP